MGKLARLTAPRPSVDNAVSPGETMPEGAPRRTILYIDGRRLTRDCVGEQLAMYLPSYAFESAGSAGELQPGSRAESYALVVLHAHSTCIGSADLAAEMSRIARLAPGSPLVLISDLDSGTEVAAAFKLGVRGYLPSNLPIRQATDAIRLVKSGGNFVPQSALCLAASADKEPETMPAQPKAGLPGLSPRQLQVLRLLQQGKQNKTIAYELNMCESTVKVHVRHLMRKLHARNRTQVVVQTQQMIGHVRVG